MDDLPTAAHLDDTAHDPGGASGDPFVAADDPDLAATTTTDTTTGDLAASGPPLWLGPAVAVALVVLDQVVKYLVEQVLTPGVFVPWLSGSIGWQLVYNDGAAFGLPLPWWAFLVVASAVVVVVWRNLPQVVRVLPVVAYGMLTAGALGNVVDRLVRTGDPGDPRFLHGHVVDFVAWGAFPRFNVADAAITVGFVLLAWDLWRHDDQEALPGGPSEGRG